MGGFCRMRYAVEGTGGRERPAEEDRRRPDAGPRDAAGRHPPKALRPARKRKLVDGMLVDWGVSIRGPARRCGSTPRATITSPAAPDRPASKADQGDMRDTCALRLPRVHVLLRREGWQVNIKKTRRIYNELGLQLRNKCPKRRVKAKLREDRQEAAGPNEVWAMDFVHDQLALGKKLRILTIVDTHSRYCRWPILASPTAARTWSRPSNGSATRSAIRRRSGRQRHRVRQPGPRPVGLCQRGHPRLLATGQADRQRLHRGVEFEASGGVPEHALVHGPCRRPRKTGSLASRLQRGQTAQRDRIQRPDRSAHSRWRSQPSP